MQSHLHTKPRNIKDFHGEAVVLGCGHLENYCTNNHPYDKYLTVNIKEDPLPDYIADVMQPLPDGFDKRFKLSIAEGLPLEVYNPYVTCLDFHQINPEAENGFNNLFAMTQDNGFILIMGCDKYQEVRFFLRNYKYIEFSYPPSRKYDPCHTSSVVLIPKNQSLTIEEIQADINQCDVLLSYLETQKLTAKQPYQSLQFFNNKEFFSKPEATTIYCATLQEDNKSVKMEKIIRPPSPLMISLMEKERKSSESKAWSNTALGLGTGALLLGLGLFAYAYCKRDLLAEPTSQLFAKTNPR